MISSAGNIFYQDEYGTQYRVEWITNDNIKVIDTYAYQPYVWSKPPRGFIDKRILYKEGIITVDRIAYNINSNQVVAEGIDQYIDNIQMNYPCGNGPKDIFKYHFDHYVTEESTHYVIQGPHWVDIDVEGVTPSLWGDINNDGSPIDLTITGDSDTLVWEDIWSNG